MLYIEPAAGAAPIIRLINQARHEVSVGVYYLTNRPILRALKAAHDRGVDVRVMIDGKPYGMKPWQVHKEEREIEATGATLKLAPYLLPVMATIGRSSMLYVIFRSRCVRLVLL